MSDRKKRVVWTHRDDQLLLKLWAERATDLGRQNADNTAEEYESISQDSKFDKSYNALAEAVAVMSTPAPSSSSSSASSKAELLTPLLTRSALSSPVPPHSPSPDPLQLPRRKTGNNY
ncbi:unnamed protein product [Ceratitis capitata]|uniref:(Mediterranean fruit fly) hypothetical protein n=1 Tax=Ceratitis capitata TaxID=7213 RepID=A0A811VA06_CERCA|nr:unnamed protein product [Ceratitis capitata]